MSFDTRLLDGLNVLAAKFISAKALGSARSPTARAKTVEKSFGPVDKLYRWVAVNGRLLVRRTGDFREGY